MRTNWMRWAAMAAGVVMAAGCATTTTSVPGNPDVIDVNSAQAKGDLEKAIVVLQESARSQDVDLRANVMEAVQPLRDGRAVLILEAGLRGKRAPGDAGKDPWLVRFAAAMAAGKRMDPAMKPEMQSLYAEETNDNVKVAMVYALKRMGDDSQMNVLMRTLNSPDSDVRANTALVLGLLGDRSAMPILKSHVDADWHVKYEQKAALARLGDDEALHAITAMAVSKVAEDEWNALQLCGELPQSIATSTLYIGLRPDKLVENGTRVENLRRTLLAARGLGKKGDRKAGPWVMSYLKDEDAGIRAMTVLALGDIFKPGQAYVLAPLLEDSDPGVRVAAASAVVNLMSRR